MSTIDFPGGPSQVREALIQQEAWIALTSEHLFSFTLFLESVLRICSQ
jgi:hypothetical protein